MVEGECCCSLLIVLLFPVMKATATVAIHSNAGFSYGHHCKWAGPLLMAGQAVGSRNCHEKADSLSESLQVTAMNGNSILLACISHCFFQPSICRLTAGKGLGSPSHFLLSKSGKQQATRQACSSQHTTQTDGLIESQSHWQIHCSPDLS